jgi:hypothetical protein
MLLVCFMNPKSVVILAVSLIFFLSFLVSWIFSFSSLNLYLYLNLYLFQLIIKYPVGVQTPSRSVKKKKMLTRSVTTSVHSKLPRNRPERTILVSPPSPAVYRLPISVTLMTGMFHRQHHAPAVYRLPSCTDLCDSLTGMWSRQLQQLKRSSRDGLTGMWT